MTAPLLDLRPTFRRFPLARLRSAGIAALAGVPVRSSRISRFDGAANSALDPSALTTLVVPFGAMSAQRFALLHGAFGSLSRVTHSPNRRFEVVDFLPPAVQAVLGLDVELPPAVPIAGTGTWDPRRAPEPVEVSLDVNCHGTTWGLLGAYHGAAGEFPLFFGDMLCMDSELHSDRFEVVESLDPGQVPLLSVLPLRPGDVVAFFEVSEFARATMLVHTALHVGAGLLVEKPNTEAAGEDSPYRLATPGMVVEPLEAALLGSALRAEVLRPCDPLRPLTEVFASSYAVRLRGLANRARRPLGMEVVPQNEYGLGGGITSEAICAVARLPVVVGPDGRGSLG